MNSIWKRNVALAGNGLRLCVRLRSVGIERWGNLHKTAVMRMCGGYLAQNLIKGTKRKI